MEKPEAFLCPFCGAPYRELIPAGIVQVKCRYCGATVLVPPRLGGLLQLCPNHPGLLTVGICDDCGKSLCGDCLFFVKTYPQESRQPLPKYSHFCSDCMKRKGLKYWSEPNQALIVVGVFILYIGIFMFVVSFIAGMFLFFIGFALMFASRGEKFSFPTVSMVMEKMAELNKRAEKVKAAMSPQEVEDLYGELCTRMLIPDPHTGKVERSRIDSLIKEYMQSGLSRKDAILKVASEEGIEIKPGLHIPPTMGDALSELKKEMKKVELAKEEIKISEKAGELYEQLLYAYTAVYGGGRQALEREIKSLMEQGFSREEAIYNLAEKERLIEKV